MKSIKVKDFSLKHTLECGQFFRYYLKDGWYYVNSRDKFFRVRQISDKVEYGGVGVTFLRKFFSLDVDYDGMIVKLKKDKHLRKAVDLFNGLRLIRQDPWECTVSYICSSASNIPKIRMNVELLSKKYGKAVYVGGEESFSFPELGELGGLCGVKAAKTGYRAKYLCKLNEFVRNNNDFFENLNNKDYNVVKDELVELPGVGPKIADCILLFSLDKGEAFPVDVHIKRAMQELYFKGDEVKDDEIRAFAAKKWGKDAGLAQQYLYHWWRNR